MLKGKMLLVFLYALLDSRQNKEMKKTLLISALVGLFGLVILFFSLPSIVDSRLNQVYSSKEKVFLEETNKLHQSLFIADWHSDSLLSNRDLSQEYERGHVDFVRMRKGNMALQMFTTVTEVPMWVVTQNKEHDFDAIFPLALIQKWPQESWESNFYRAIYQSQKLKQFVERDKKMSLITSKSELTEFLSKRAEDKEQIAGLLGIEGAHVLEGKFENLDKLFEAGFRMLSMAHFFDNEISGSAHGESKSGLSELGERIIRRMNMLSMIIDISHTSHEGIQDVLDISTKPVISSHTGVRGTCDNERNLSDEQIKKIAGRGGIIGIAFFKWAICGEDVDAIVKAINYTINLVGPKHVALGSDFDGAVKVPFDVSHMNLLTNALLESGRTHEEIALIMGENIKRFLLENLP